MANPIERILQLMARATPAPWVAYSEPDVGLQTSLFAGTPMQSDFGPMEPLSPIDVELIAAMREWMPRLLFASSPMTSNDLWVSLENVLRDKGASDKWLEYAMPDLQVAAMQFSFSQYAQGHRDALAGKELPNPRPDDKPLLIVTESDGSRWLQINGGAQ